MKYIVSLDGKETDPVGLDVVIALYQSGALLRNSRLREETVGSEWSTPERALPFLSAVRTWREIAVESGPPKSFVLKGVEIGFADLVKLIFKLSLAAIPATILLWLLMAALGLVAATIFGGMTRFH